MKVLTILHLVAQFFVLVGALNWGLVGFFQQDAVKSIFGVGTMANLVYKVVGISALYLILLRFL